MQMTAPRFRELKQLDAGVFQAEISSFALCLAAEGKAAKTIRTYTEAGQWFAAPPCPGRPAGAAGNWSPAATSSSGWRSSTPTLEGWCAYFRPSVSSPPSPTLAITHAAGREPTAAQTPPVPPTSPSTPQHCRRTRSHRNEQPHGCPDSHGQREATPTEVTDRSERDQTPVREATDQKAAVSSNMVGRPSGEGVVQIQIAHLACALAHCRRGPDASGVKPPEVEGLIHPGTLVVPV
jgi:hypothetical protein